MSAKTRRGLALERLIRIAQALQRVRFGLTTHELLDEIRDVSDRRWSLRSVYRDLQVLERVGLVEIIVGNPNIPTRVRWCGEGGFFEQSASAIGIASDSVARRRHEITEVA